MEHRFVLKTPHKHRVIRELDLIIREWRDWEREVGNLGSDLSNQGHPHLDGDENIRTHRILQEKTLAFLNKNVEGHGFITGRDGTHIDRTDLRLNIRVKHRLSELDDLRARIEYVDIPPGLIRKGAAKLGGLVPEVVSNVITRLISGGSSGSD